MRVHRSVGVCVRLRACSLAYPACNAYAPSYDVIYGSYSSTKCFDIISYTAPFSEKKLLNMKHKFWLCLQSFPKTILILSKI